METTEDVIQVTEIPDDGLIEKADGTVLSVGDQLTTSEVTSLTYTPTKALVENSVGDNFSYSVGSDSVNVSFGQASSGVSEPTLFTYYNPVHVTNLDSLFTDGTGTSPSVIPGKLVALQRKDIVRVSPPIDAKPGKGIVT